MRVGEAVKLYTSIIPSPVLQNLQNNIRLFIMELQSTFKVRCIPYIVARYFIKLGNQKNSSNV